MAVNIEVNLKKIDSTDLQKIKRQLNSLDDNLDIDLDLDDLLSGDFDEIEIKLDEDKLVGQIRRAFHKVSGEAGANFFEGDRGEGTGGLTSRIQIKQLGKIVAELNKINRKLAGSNFGQNITVTENLPNFRKQNTKFGVEKIGSGAISSRLDDYIDKDSIRKGLNEKFKITPNNIDLDKFKPGISFNNSSRNLANVFDLVDNPGKKIRQSRLKKNLNVVPDLSSYDQKKYARGLKNAIPGRMDNRMNLSKLRTNMDKVDGLGQKLVRTFSKLQPSFRRVYAVTATLLPAMLGLAVQLGAVATAAGALLAAGGIIGLLGAFGGEAETLSGSLKQAENRMKDFKRALFDAIEPVADLFGPILDKFLGKIVKNVRGLRGELAGLKTFSGIFFKGLDAASKTIAELLQTTIRLAPVIKNVVGFFGGIIASRLPRFFANVVKEAGKSSKTLAKIGAFLFQLGRLTYFAVKAVVNFLSVLSVFTPMIRLVADVLGNKWVQSLIIIISSIISLIGLILLASKVLGALVAVILALNGQLILQGSLLSAIGSLWAGSWIANAISGISGLISMVMALNGVLGLTAQLLTAVVGLATLGAGLVLAAGAVGAVGEALSPDMPTTGNGGGGDTYNNFTMNVEGNTDELTRAKMGDIASGTMHRRNMTDGKFGSNR